MQGRWRTRPTYRTIEIEGPPHERMVAVEAEVEGHTLACGKGRSKKEAERAAASTVLGSFDELLRDFAHAVRPDRTE